MEVAAFVVVVLIFTTAAAIVARGLHNKDVSMGESLAESKRLNRIIDEAMDRYPGHSEMRAMQSYLWDLEERVEALRLSAEGADVLYAIESDKTDCQLLRKEIKRLMQIDLEFKSGFNVLHAAEM